MEEAEREKFTPSPIAVFQLMWLLLPVGSAILEEVARR